MEGIAFPVEFRTNKLSRAKTKKIDWSDEREIIKPSRPVDARLELYFSPKELTWKEVDIIEPGKSWEKEKNLYYKHNVYGDHQFLVPAILESIALTKAEDRLWSLEGYHEAFGMINGSPTTAAAHERLQLIPCDANNLPLFIEKFQSLPFVIEISKGVAIKGKVELREFHLHVKSSEGTYTALICQSYSPRCWHSGILPHSVVTLHKKHGYKPVAKFDEIPWDDVATIGMNSSLNKVFTR